MVEHSGEANEEERRKYEEGESKSRGWEDKELKRKKEDETEET